MLSNVLRTRCLARFMIMTPAFPPQVICHIALPISSYKYFQTLQTVYFSFSFLTFFLVFFVAALIETSSECRAVPGHHRSGSVCSASLSTLGGVQHNSRQDPSRPSSSSSLSLSLTSNSIFNQGREKKRIWASSSKIPRIYFLDHIRMCRSPNSADSAIWFFLFLICLRQSFSSGGCWLLSRHWRGKTGSEPFQMLCSSLHEARWKYHNSWQHF